MGCPSCPSHTDDLRIKGMLFYFSERSLLRKVNPCTLLSTLIMVNLISFHVSQKIVAVTMVLLIGSAWISRLELRRWRLILPLMTGFLFIITIGYLFFSQISSGKILWNYPWGDFVTTGTFFYMIDVALRYLVCAMATVLFFANVRESELIALFQSLHFPGVLLWALALILRGMGLLVGDFQKIIEVLRGRGISFRGQSLRDTFILMKNVLWTFLISAFVRMDGLNQTLYLRGVRKPTRPITTRRLSWTWLDIIVLLVDLSIILWVIGKGNHVGV